MKIRAAYNALRDIQRDAQLEAATLDGSAAFFRAQAEDMRRETMLAAASSLSGLFDNKALTTALAADGLPDIAASLDTVLVKHRCEVAAASKVLEAVTPASIEALIEKQSDAERDCLVQDAALQSAKLAESSSSLAATELLLRWENTPLWPAYLFEAYAQQVGSNPSWWTTTFTRKGASLKALSTLARSLEGGPSPMGVLAHLKQCEAALTLARDDYATSVLARNFASEDVRSARRKREMALATTTQVVDLSAEKDRILKDLLKKTSIEELIRMRRVTENPGIDDFLQARVVGEELGKAASQLSSRARSLRTLSSSLDGLVRKLRRASSSSGSSSLPSKARSLEATIDQLRAAIRDTGVYNQHLNNLVRGMSTMPVRATPRHLVSDEIDVTFAMLLYNFWLQDLVIADAQSGALFNALVDGPPLADSMQSLSASIDMSQLASLSDSASIPSVDLGSTGLNIPDVSIPDFTMPDISMPDISIPDFSSSFDNGSSFSGFDSGSSSF